MDVYKSVIYDLDNDDIASDTIVSETKRILGEDVDNPRIVYVYKCNKYDYVREVATGICLPYIDNGKLIYVDEEKEITMPYHGRRYFYNPPETKILRRTSVPKHILTLPHTATDYKGGIPKFSLYEEVVDPAELSKYLEKHDDIGRRYNYLRNYVYKTKNNSNDFLMNKDKLVEEKKKVVKSVRNDFSLFSKENHFPWKKRTVYSVKPFLINDGNKLPLKISLKDEFDVGSSIFSNMEFDNINPITNKLLVEVDFSGKLKELKTKERIPYVYYKVSKDEKTATLMIDNREARENDVIKFFVFTPEFAESLEILDKQKIKTYKRSYTDFNRILKEYTDRNNLNNIASSFNDDNLLKKEEEIKEEPEKVVEKKDLAFKELKFNQRLTLILEIRQHLQDPFMDAIKKCEYIKRLNDLIEWYDLEQAKIVNQVLIFQHEANLDNEFINKLMKLDADIISDSDSIKKYDFIFSYVTYLKTASNDQIDNFKNIYDFLNDFKVKANSYGGDLLTILNAQNVINEALFDIMLTLDEISINVALSLVDENTLEMLSTIMDIRIDKLRLENGDFIAFRELKNLNMEKAQIKEKDMDYLKSYLSKSLAIYNQLSDKRVYMRRGR